MTKLANKHNILILAGAGVTLTNIDELLSSGLFNEVHLGSSVRIDNSYDKEIDPTLIKTLKTKLPNKKGQ